MARVTRQVRSIAIVAAVAFVGGCGDGIGSLSGKVSYQDKPVIYGTVKVRCSSGIERVGNIATDGSYTITDIPAGPVKIAVISPEPPDLKSLAKRGERPGDKRAVEPAVDKANWRKLPDEFADPERSGQTATISGSTTLDIRLP